MLQDNSKYIIKVKDLLNRSYQVETFNLNSKEASALYMHNVYLQAQQLVQAIINNQNTEFRMNEAGISTEPNNVIAFVGRRGTGKTSAMLSFARYLSTEIIEDDNEEHTSSFFVLKKHINASMFQENDYLLRSVLAEIYSDLEQNHSNFTSSQKAEVRYAEAHHKEIKRILVQTLHDYKNIENRFEDLNNAEAELSAQTSYLSVQRQLKEVVDLFLQFRLNYKKTDRSFLVICIDDIDMAINNQSKIMYDINRYLMIPNVIVLVTANLRNLELAMHKTYVESLSPKSSSDACVKRCEGASFDQTIDYLRKLIPTDMRITMPSWRKVDYQDLTPFYIDVEGYDKLPRFKDCARIPQDELRPKQFIMFILSRRTGVFLDAWGHKHHFMEPDSLRDLYDKFYLLYNMNPINLKEDGRLDIYALRANRKILLDYLYFKIKPEMHFDDDDSDKNFAEELEYLPIERRGRNVWKYYYARLQQKQDHVKRVYGDQFYNDEILLHKEKYYCFGEVFRVIYTASRIDVFSKDLVKLILASFSFALPEYVEKREIILLDSIKKPPFSPSDSEIANIEEGNELKQTVDELEKVFDDSMLGTWHKREFIHSCSLYGLGSRAELLPEDRNICVKLNSGLYAVMILQYYAKEIIVAQEGLAVNDGDVLARNNVNLASRRIVPSLRAVYNFISDYPNYPNSFSKDDLHNFELLDIIDLFRSNYKNMKTDLTLLLNNIKSDEECLDFTNNYVLQVLEQFSNYSLVNVIVKFVSCVCLFTSKKNVIGKFDRNLENRDTIFISDIEPSRFAINIARSISNDIWFWDDFNSISINISELILSCFWHEINDDGHSIPAFFLLKHTDIAYNIFKRMMIEELYYSDGHPAELKEKDYNSKDENGYTHAEKYLIFFFRSLLNSLEKQWEIYDRENTNDENDKYSGEIGKLLKFLASISETLELFLSSKSPEKIIQVYWKNENQAQGTSSKQDTDSNVSQSSKSRPDYIIKVYKVDNQPNLPEEEGIAVLTETDLPNESNQITPNPKEEESE